MKSITTPVGMIIGLLQIGLTAATAFAATGKVVGTVGMVEGNVLVDNTPVKKTAPVHEGSVIEVKRGKATLIVGKGNVFNLSADSKMVVTEFGLKAGADGAAEEKGQLDLKFGRTRALFLNTGAEKKDLKIKARAATMGVRGTEIFIDAPRDSSRPVNFFTLEGKAEVRAADTAPAVAVAQNQGVSTNGSASGAGAGSAPASATLTMAEVKAEIKSDGIQGSTISTPQDLRRQVTQQYMSDQFGMGALPPLVLDPLQDRFTPVKLAPRFCNAGTGACP